MEVILKEDIQSLGKAGDIVKVKDGYARNFLLPRGVAVVAEKGNVKELEHHKRAVAARQAKLKMQAEALAARLAGLSLTLSREAGEEDKLFGSVTNKDIAEALRRENIVIDRRHIALPNPIRQIGVFEVPVHLHSEVTATLKVWVVKA